MREYDDNLIKLLNMQQLVEDLLTNEIRNLRNNGITWQQIADVFGTTRQAALMRWNPKIV
jgi:transcriptional regulator